MPTERTADRLRRILVLVPWVIANPRPTVADVCRRFGLTREELVADLDLLLVCGLPPFGPGDLIEAFIEGGHVSIRMAEYLEKPPRLTRGEAVALLVMGRAIAALPGLQEASSLRTALDKLADAVSPSERDRAFEMTDRMAVELDATGSDLLTELRAAIRDRARLSLGYYSHGRGELTERDVDPWLVFQAMGNWYMVGLDHLSNEERTFRVDRIKDVRRAGASFDPPEGLDADRYRDGPVFTPSPDDRRAVVEAGPRAGWIAEVIPAESVAERGGGWTRIELRTAHFAWLVRLVLSAGPDARALHPPELVDDVRAAARTALALYEPSD